VLLLEMDVNIVDDVVIVDFLLGCLFIVIWIS